VKPCPLGRYTREAKTRRRDGTGTNPDQLAEAGGTIEDEQSACEAQRRCQTAGSGVGAETIL